MKTALLVLALFLPPLAMQAFDTDPTTNLDGTDHPPRVYLDRHDRFRDRDQETPENFDKDYDTRPRVNGYRNNNGYHPVFDQIRVQIIHIIHHGPTSIQSMQLPTMELVSGQKAMLKVNDRRFRVYATVQPTGKVDIDLAYLKRSNFAVQSTLLTDKKVTLTPKKSGAIVFGNEEFRIIADVGSREENQWYHLQQHSRFSEGGYDYGYRPSYRRGSDE
jgi:hypothetical protein